MRFLFIYILFSSILPIQYAIIYDDSLFEQADAIKNLYNNQINANFKLETEIFSNTYINNNYTNDNISEKTQSFIKQIIKIF